jgi:hypothetical protein
VSTQDRSQTNGRSPVDGGSDTAHELVGGFSYDLKADQWTWSEPTYRIHGFEPGDVVPTTELIRYHLHEEDRDAVVDTFRSAIDAGSVFSLHFRIRDARGSSRTVLALGTGHDCGRGDAPGLRGQLVDLTSLHDDAVNDDVGVAVDDFRSHRAVIEQAKGVMMQILGVDEDAAFQEIRAFSQRANVKVRDLATLLVDAAAHSRTPSNDDPGLSVTELFEALTAAASPGLAQSD